MSHFDHAERLAPRVRVLQMVIGALTMGVVTFLAIAVAIREGGVADFKPAPDPSGIRYLLLGIAGMMLLAGLVVPGIVVSARRRQMAGQTESARAEEMDQLFGLFQVKTVVGAALTEGAAFLAIITYLLYGEVAALIAAGVFAALLLLLVPTWSRIERWLEDQMRRLAEERQTGTSPG